MLNQSNPTNLASDASSHGPVTGPFTIELEVSAEPGNRPRKRPAREAGGHRPSDVSSVAAGFSPSCTVSVVQTVTTTDALHRVGTALADPTRRRILLALLNGPAYPADLADTLRTGRTNISNHLACLRGCGLVRTAREGRQVRYELASPRLAHALGDLVDLQLEIEAGHEGFEGHG